MSCGHAASREDHPRPKTAWGNPVLSMSGSGSRPEHTAAWGWKQSGVTQTMSLRAAGEAGGARPGHASSSSVATVLTHSYKCLDAAEICIDSSN